jgi:hypothetical protein
VAAMVVMLSMASLSGCGSGGAGFPKLDLGQASTRSSMTFTKAVAVALANVNTWPGGWRLSPYGSDLHLKYPYIVELSTAVAAQNLGLSTTAAQQTDLISLSGADFTLRTAKQHGTGYFGMGNGSTDLYVYGFKSSTSAKREAIALIRRSDRTVPHSSSLGSIPHGRLYIYTACSFQKCGGYIFAVSNYVVEGNGDCSGCGSSLLDSQAEAIYYAARGL